MADHAPSVKNALDRVQRRHISSHLTPYYTWIRHVIALSLAALTALISLQGSYLPSNPQLPIVLVICWAGLLSSALLGTFALAEEFRLPLKIANQVADNRAQIGDHETYRLVAAGRFYEPSWHHRWAVKRMTMSFVLALCSLFTFATINLLANAS
jgi:hypothetical protein